MIGPDHSAMIHDRIIQPDFAPCKILTKRQMHRRQTIMDDQELDWDESNCSCFGFCGCFFSCLQDRKVKIATQMLFGAVAFFFFSKHKMQEFLQEKKTGKKCIKTATYKGKTPVQSPPPPVQRAWKPGMTRNWTLEHIFFFLQIFSSKLTAHVMQPGSAQTQNDKPAAERFKRPFVCSVFAI